MVNIHTGRLLRQDSGDYAGYEQALQRGFTKAAKAPKKVRCVPAVNLSSNQSYPYSWCCPWFVNVRVGIRLHALLGACWVPGASDVSCKCFHANAMYVVPVNGKCEEDHIICLRLLRGRPSSQWPRLPTRRRRSRASACPTPLPSRRARGSAAGVCLRQECMLVGGVWRSPK